MPAGGGLGRGGSQRALAPQMQSLHASVRGNNLDGIVQLQKELSTEDWQVALCSRDEDHHTPLALALLNDNTQMVSFLLSAGAAKTAFVHGVGSNHFLCTLPMSHPISPTLHTSKIGADIASKKSNMLAKPSADATSLLDEAIQGFISNLAGAHLDAVRAAGSEDPPVSSVEDKATPPVVAKPPATNAEVELEINDHVRLRKGIRSSSVEVSFRESSNSTASQLCLGEYREGRVGIVVHKSQPWRTGDARKEQIFVVASAHRLNLPPDRFTALLPRSRLPSLAASDIMKLRKTHVCCYDSVTSVIDSMIAGMIASMIA
eukprot:3937874-Rhodomonas_salina.4